MLLTVSLSTKGSLLASFLNKCRQVVRIKPNQHIETNNKPNISTPLPIKSINTNTTELPTNEKPTLKNSQNKSSRPAVKANICTTSLVASKTYEEQVGLPPRPKKPLTPYFRFMRDQRPKMQASNPKLNIIDVVREVSKKWGTAEQSLKDRLQAEYKKEQEQYIEKRTKYDARITDEQRAQIKELKQEKIEAKEKRMVRKRIKELGKPRKPASAFLRFIAKERTVSPQTPKQTFREWHQRATEKWGKLSTEEKNVFLLESRKELDVYKKTLSEWEEKMIRLGNIDVVRHSNLIDPPEPKPKKH